MNEPCTRRPIAVDLFAGAGGLSLGFEQAGFDLVAAVEFDPVHAATHEYNFPYGITICKDIRELTGEDIRLYAGLESVDIDVVIGGPPCQGFSLIGHRVLEDSRNELVFQFLRIVDELRPKAFVLENVPGMATGKHTQLLEELIEGFRRIDYRITPYNSHPKDLILNASQYGVPQDRRRLFLVGTRKGFNIVRHPDPITRKRPKRSSTSNGILEPMFVEADLPLCPSVQDAIGDLTAIELSDELFETDVLEFRLSGGSEYARILRGEKVDENDFSYRRRYDRRFLTGNLRARHTKKSRQRFDATEPGTTEKISRFYRLHPDGMSNTLRAGTASDRGAFSAPRPIHPEFARCISVREAARLHSFPDWFRFHRTIWHGFRQIGNAVPPLLARHLAREILKSLNAKQIRPSKTIDLVRSELMNMNMSEAADHFGVSRNVIPGRNRSSDSIG